jgi:hypothetical protein
MMVLQCLILHLGRQYAIAFAEWLDPAYVEGVEAILAQQD